MHVCSTDHNVQENFRLVEGVAAPGSNDLPHSFKRPRQQQQLFPGIVSRFCDQDACLHKSTGLIACPFGITWSDLLHSLDSFVPSLSLPQTPLEDRARELASFFDLIFGSPTPRWSAYACLPCFLHSFWPSSSLEVYLQMSLSSTAPTNLSTMRHTTMLLLDAGLPVSLCRTVLAKSSTSPSFA